MNRNYLLLGLTGLLLTAGCQKNDDQIQTYRVAKESASPMAPMTEAPRMGANAGAASNTTPPPMMGNATAPPASEMQSAGDSMGLKADASPRDVDWTVPAGWQVQPPSAMRVGSFLYKGKNGYTADISVVPLGGEAGGDLANINRWRGQINLKPISEAELASTSQIITPGGRKMRMVDMVSQDFEIDNKSPKRLVAVIYNQGHRSWFFKMLGEDKTVEEAKPSFLQFIKSLRFHDNA